MLWDNAETIRIIEAIRAGAKRWTKDELDSVLQPARRRKPRDLDKASRDAQVRYRGNQRAIIEAQLQKRFPYTENMPVSGINLMKLIARSDAGVYVVPSDRWLDDERGARIESDDDAGKLWQWALEKSRFHAQMAEMERRALITPGCSVGHMVWVKPPGDPIGYPRIDLYWPHDVEVICHWQAPTSWEFAYVVALRQAAPAAEDTGDWWRVYSRTPPDDITGNEPWGDWFSVLVSTNGDEAAAYSRPVKHEGKRLPAFIVQLTDPEGSVFVCQDMDLIDVVDSVNVDRSNENLVIGMQGHNQLWTDSINEVATLKGGPDAVMQVGPNRTLNVLSFNPALADMRESRKLNMRELAISRATSPDAYAYEPGPPLSGVAKRVANLAHDTRVAEQATIVQHIETTGPLPILQDLVSTFHPDGALIAKARPRMNPRRLPTFEEPAQKQQRLESAAKAGWISDARGAADAEFYPDVDTAQAAIDEIEAAKPDPPPAPPAPPGVQPPPIPPDGNEDPTIIEKDNPEE